MDKNTLQLPAIAFTIGFVLMVFELAAARLLAPTLGSSVYVWTSVIGIVIAALSVGVWVGGQLADKRNLRTDIAWLLLGCGLAICFMLVASGGVLDWLTNTTMDQRAKGMLASLLLFAPTSFLIGACGPYLAKFNVKSLESTGQSIANLDAMNALGGICGTFLTGFFLFALLGTKGIFFILVLLLVALSWVISPQHQRKKRAAFSAALACAALLAVAPTNTLRGIALDTATAHYTINEGVRYGQTVRVLTTGPSASQSGVNLANTQTLIFWYTREIAAVINTLPAQGNVLVLGGGAFTLPSAIAHSYPNTQVDVVEIDPELTGIAKQYFGYTEKPNVTIINQDARTFLQTATTTYDIIVIDVYSDVNVPFTFMTKQYGEALVRRLTPGGAVLVNAIGGPTGACHELLQAVLAPYMPQFRQAWIKQSPDAAMSRAANHVAYFSNIAPPAALASAGYSAVQNTNQPTYTDDFAPVEPLQFACSQT